MSVSYELILSKLTELKNKLDQIPRGTKIHLPDKPNNISNLEVLKYLDDRELAITFSVGNHYYGGDFDLITQDLVKYLQALENHKNINELLIVSGSSKRKIDTLGILQYISNHSNRFVIKQKHVFSVAYNCNSENQTVENARLTQKLQHQVVEKVYIQITDDIAKIITGINFIRSLNSKISICVCVFEPTNSSLAKFKFRPWKGVVLSNEFLSGYQKAVQINKTNLKVLEDQNVELIFTL